LSPCGARSTYATRCQVRFQNSPPVIKLSLPSRTSRSLGLVALDLIPNREACPCELPDLPSLPAALEIISYLDCATDHRSGSATSRQAPATPFSARRVSVENTSPFHASRRSRKLGTAFRSPVTTLSPPLRGQRSRPAPSLPRRIFFANPFDQKLLRSVWFRSRNRANSSPLTRCPRRSPALS